MLTINEAFRKKLEAAVPEVSNIADTVAEQKSDDVSSKQLEVQSFGYGEFSGRGSVYSHTGPIPIFTGVFQGEKSEGTLGAPINLLPDYWALKFRAYEANLTNPTVRTITSKFFKWVVGKGLKMQVELYEKLLELEGVVEDFDKFKANVEEYWPLWASSTRSDYSGMVNLHKNARFHKETSFLGGDVLTVLRVDANNNLTVQVIDGQHVRTPIIKNADILAAAASGNFIRNGVEMDSKGKHIAFYVRKQSTASTFLAGVGEYERIEAYGKKTGLKMAWMSYGLKHRIDQSRGIPVITAILETVQLVDRYNQATVMTAEERANVVFTVEHGKTSNGENPLLSKVRAGTGAAATPDVFAQGEAAAQKISTSQNKQVHNLPVDSRLVAVSSQTEIQYEPFFKAFFNQICASMDIPPEVAMQLYNSNYSASRAAINAWGYLIDIARQDLVDDYYQPVYDVWLYLHILKNKVKADKYLKARATNNIDVIEAYSATKFTGVNMPHIDPLKEINAIREALGEAYANVPLISLEQATDAAAYGDWETNIKKLSKEKQELDNLKLVPDPATASVQPTPGKPKNQVDPEDDED